MVMELNSTKTIAHGISEASQYLHDHGTISSVLLFQRPDDTKDCFCDGAGISYGSRSIICAYSR